MQKLLERFSDSMIVDDAVLVRTTLPVDKDVGIDLIASTEPLSNVGGDFYIKALTPKTNQISALGTEKAHDSKPKADHNDSRISKINLNCEVCGMTKTTHVRFTSRPLKRVDGISPPTSFGELATADNNNSNLDGESRHDHGNALIVQHGHSCWLQSYPTEKEKMFAEIPVSISKVRMDLHRTTQRSEYIRACQDLQWNLDANALHRSELNGIRERCVRRVKKGTATAMVQRGPDQWWDSTRECHCSLRKVHDSDHPCEQPGKAASMWQKDVSWNLHATCITCDEGNGQVICSSRIGKTSRICQPQKFTSDGSSIRKSHTKEKCCFHVKTDLPNF